MSTTDIATTALVPTLEGAPSLAMMRERIAYQRDMRTLLIEYVRSSMRDEHFYTIGEGKGAKPALSQDGARNLCSLYQVSPTSEFLESYEPDGHYTCRATVILSYVNSGVECARGTGSCTTHESKYAYRWVFENQVPRGLIVSELQKRKAGSSNYWLYRIPNDMLADQYNTVLKMAEKRAFSSATLRLPCAAEIFVAEPEDDEEHVTQKQAAERTALLGILEPWAKGLPKDRAPLALETLWRVATPRQSIASWTTDTLRVAAQMVQAAEKIGLDWNAVPAILEKALQDVIAKSGKAASSDLFGKGE